MKHRITRKIGSRAGGVALGLSLLVAGCAQTTGEPAYFRSVLIGDRGISVPLPPPSLTAAPKQSVDIEVVVQGEGDLSDGTELRIVDNEGELELTISVDADAFLVEGATLDLTQNCLEVWLLDGDREGEHALFSASIAGDDQTVETAQGCD